MLLGFAFNSFWAAGYFIYSGVTNEGDWALVIRGSALSIVWRAGLAALGVVACIFSGAGKSVAIVECRRLVLIPSFAAGGVACVAALFDFSDPIGPLVGAAWETFLANIVLLGVLRRNAGLQRPVSSAPSYITPTCMAHRNCSREILQQPEIIYNRFVCSRDRLYPGAVSEIWQEVIITARKVGRLHGRP